MKASRLEIADTVENASLRTLQDKVAELDQHVAEGRAKVATATVNTGLKMILVALVICVLISWGGTIAVKYVTFMMVQELAQTDQDSLRVMCAVDPPSEQEFNRLHLCELVATGGSTVASRAER